MGIREDIQALGRGELDLEGLKRRVEVTLSDPDASAGEILVALSDGHQQGNLSNADYSHLTQFVSDTLTPPISENEVPDNELANEKPVPDEPTNVAGGYEPDDSLTRLDTSYPTGDEEALASVDIGTRLRDRFILDEVVGVGGMGTVYRGRDILKIEAKDRNPYVAVKVLNDSFKQRPDAFIALQREASRQQRLAHPNIATVYDFDRSGGVMYITMEYLDGQTLDQFLKDNVRDSDGLPFDDALPIVQGLCAALSYAHERGIVHADFKPGNCFITEAQGIKVLDFGIARAMKDPNAAAADHTLFDPRSIGALTPAYASPEMLADSEGADPRDDIYALACVTYELLSGKHPFHRIPADQAKANDLKPAKIKQLSRRQNDAMARALAFDRIDRTPSAGQFLTEISDETSSLAFSWRLLGVAAAVVAAIAAAILVPRFLDEQQFQEIQAQLLSGETAMVDTGLDALAGLEPAAQARMLQESRQPLLRHFRTEFERELSAPDWQVDYNAAERVLDSAQNLYPDSAALNRLTETYLVRKDAHLSDLANGFEEYLSPAYLIAKEGNKNLPALLKRLQSVDPSTSLLLDTRIAGAYAGASEQAIQSQDYAQARNYVATGQQLMPDDPVLADLSDRLQGIQQRIALAQQIAEREERLRSAAAKVTELSVLSTLIAPLNQLKESVPNSAVITTVAQSLNTQLSPAFSERLTSRRLADITALAELDSSWLALELGDKVDARLQRVDDLEAEQDRVTGSIRRELSANRLTALPPLLATLEEIDSNDPQLPALREEIISTMRLRAQSLAAQQQWENARQLLRDTEPFAKQAAQRRLLSDASANISELESVHGARLAAAAQQAEQDRVEALRRATEEQQRAEQLAREQVIASTVSGIDTALAGLSSKAPLVAAEQVLGRLDALRKLDNDHPRLNSASSELTRRVRELIQAQPDSSAALQLLAEARQILNGPTLYRSLETTLRERQAEEAQAALQARIRQAQQAVAAALTTQGLERAVGRRAVADEFTRLLRIAGTDHAATVTMQARILSAYSALVEPLVDAKRFSAAADLLASANEIDATDTNMAALRTKLQSAQAEYRAARAEQERNSRLEALSERFTREIGAKQLARAGATLSEYRQLAPSSEFVSKAPQRLTDALATQANAVAAANQITNARKLLAQGRELSPTDTRWTNIEEAITTAQLRLRVQAWFRGTSQRSPTQVQQAIGDLRDRSGSSFGGLLREWENTAIERLAQLQGQREVHNRFLEAASKLLPSGRRLAEIDPIAAPTPRPSINTTQTRPIIPALPATQESATTTTVVPATLAFSNITGNWCSDGLQMAFAPKQMTFTINRQRIDYDVTQYEYAQDLVRVFWRDRRVGDMIFEFGEFNADKMTQVRGRKANSNDWQTYNRALQRCR